MSKLQIPKGYAPKLGAYDTQTAIGRIKRTFEDQLSAALNLKRVSAPLFVDPATGLNDDLNGIERAVSFDIAETGSIAAVVHSLAKWKRMALYKYGFPAGEGLYTDMNAIRRDEEMDNLHSIYVDQWDWERVITPETRNTAFLKEIVTKIVDAIVSTQELEDLYPGLSPKQRENEYVKAHRTVFIMQIGDRLKSGIAHDGRAPDYDDWKLNGDIMFWNDTLGTAFEVSSMGIRVDSQSLDEQLSKAGADARRALPFHKLLLDGTLPLTIGGGIGQSRVCMLLLEKAHIGEVQVSIWDDETVAGCEKAGIPLL